MTELSGPDKDLDDREAAGLAEMVGRDAARKERARNERRYGIWFGLGMMGLVGWAIAVPTLIGIALGVWLDESWPQQFSWTISLLFIGVALGALNAWWWLRREGQPQNKNG